MGGGLSLAFPTRTPPSPLVAGLSGVMISSPLLRQAKGVKAPGFVVRAGGLLGKISGALTLKAAVKPEVRFSTFFLLLMLLFVSPHYSVPLPTSSPYPPLGPAFLNSS
jgi:hypothetical protein